MKLDDIRSLTHAKAWRSEIYALKRGDVTPLIDALRSSKEILPENERSLREAIADSLAGKFKRGRGRPPLFETSGGGTFSAEDAYRDTIDRPMKDFYDRYPKNFQLFMAVSYVERYKRVQKKRYRRTRGVEAEAMEKAAAKYGISSSKIHNHIHRSKQPRPSKKKRA